MAQNEMLTPLEVAEYFKVPLKTVWRWCRHGTLPAIKFGKYWRVPKSALDALISSKSPLPVEKPEVRRG